MKRRRTPAGSNYYAPAGVAVACAVALGAGAWVFSTPAPPASMASDSVFTREVVAYEMVSAPEGEEEIVKYEYLGEKVPERLAPDEDVSKRTENSYTRVITPPADDTPGTYRGIFYPQPTFAKEGEEWRYIEHATTTKAAFSAFRTESPIATLFLRKAHAADIYSGAGDGQASAYALESGFFGECTIGGPWNTAHASEGTSASYTGTGATIYAYRTFTNDVELDSCTSDAEIIRGFVPIDTSSIPSGATITAATLNLYASFTYTGDNDGDDFMTIVQTDHAGHTSVVATDFNNCGLETNPTEGVDTGQRKDITSISTAAYTSFTLNSTGLGWIKKSGQTSSCSATNGISCFGVREGHDVKNLSVQNGAVSGMAFHTSEQTGTSQDPYLAVTYTGGATQAFWQFQDF